MPGRTKLQKTVLVGTAVGVLALVTVLLVLDRREQGGLPLLGRPDSRTGSTPPGSSDSGPTLDIPVRVILPEGDRLLDMVDRASPRMDASGSEPTGGLAARGPGIGISPERLDDLSAGPDGGDGAIRFDLDGGAREPWGTIAVGVLGLILLQVWTGRDHHSGRREGAARLTGPRDVQPSTSPDPGAAVPA